MLINNAVRTTIVKAAWTPSCIKEDSMGCDILAILYDLVESPILGEQTLPTLLHMCTERQLARNPLPTPRAENSASVTTEVTLTRSVTT